MDDSVVYATPHTLLTYLPEIFIFKADIHAEFTRPSARFTLDDPGIPAATPVASVMPSLPWIGDPVGSGIHILKDHVRGPQFNGALAGYLRDALAQSLRDAGYRLSNGWEQPLLSAWRLGIHFYRFTTVEIDFVTQSVTPFSAGTLRAVVELVGTSNLVKFAYATVNGPDWSR